MDLQPFYMQRTVCNKKPQIIPSADDTDINGRLKQAVREWYGELKMAGDVILRINVEKSKMMEIRIRNGWDQNWVYQRC